MVISNFEICNWMQVQGINTHAQHLGGGYNHPFECPSQKRAL
jgi:hypothetical protein